MISKSLRFPVVLFLLSKDCCQAEKLALATQQSTSVSFKLCVHFNKRRTLKYFYDLSFKSLNDNFIYCLINYKKCHKIL